jgi:hypothetical protein
VNGRIEARLNVFMNIEVDLNDEDGESESTGATFDLSLLIDPDGGEIVGHYVHGAADPYQ